MADKDHNSSGHGGEGEHKPHKKQHHAAHPEHEHEEGWIVSFADNVLLMMGFFVILLAMNMGPKGESDSPPGETAQDRLLDVAIAVREAFNNPLSLDSIAPEDRPLIRRMRQRMTQGEARTRGPDGENHSPQTVRPSDWAGDGGYVQFADKSSQLDDDARRTIAQLAERIAGLRVMVEVRGHASRWESWHDTKKARDLAYERAWAAGLELVERGVKWEQIRLVSSGDSAPSLARARTAEEGRTNQRVEILMINETVPSDPYSEEEAAPGTN